jgi:hypothetical protein
LDIKKQIKEHLYILTRKTEKKREDNLITTSSCIRATQLERERQDAFNAAV